MGLKERFKNAETLVEALRAQKIVMGDKELAEEISREGILVEFAPGEILMRQGDADRDLDVDGGDFLAWQQQFGSAEASPMAGPVPEPSSAALCGLLILSLATVVRPWVPPTA